MTHLDTRNPRLTRRPCVATLSGHRKTIYSIATKAGGRPPSQSEVNEMRNLANEMENAAMSKADDKEHLLDIRE